jgi:WXG100 family type VII secretion target
VELVVDPAALRAASGELTRTSRRLSDACRSADAVMAAGGASLEGGAGDRIGASWARLSQAVHELAMHYDRVGGVLDVVAQAYADLDRDVVRRGGGPR